MFLAREGDRQRNAVLNPLLATIPEFFNARASNNLFASNEYALQSVLRRPFDRLDNHSHFQMSSKAPEIRARRTLPRWEDSLMLFRVFDKQEALARFIGHFVSSVSEYSINRSEELTSLKSRITKKREEIEKAAKARLEEEKRERELKEMKEREEREEKEKREREEREAADRAERERQEQMQPHTSTNESLDDNAETASVDMQDSSDVESDSNRPEQDTSDRYTMEIGGHEIDISGLGIDPSFLEAIPEELREEALTQHLRELQASASRGDTHVEELVSTFLGALPATVRRELLNEEPDDNSAPEESNSLVDQLDNSTFFASLDPELRRTLLLEQDDEVISALTPELAAEARSARNRNFSRPDLPPFPLPNGDDFTSTIAQALHSEHPIGITRDFGSFLGMPKKPVEKKKVSAASLHFIDKQGVAALLRTLYLPQINPPDTLHTLLFNLCAENKTSRLDIINTILHILMDASVDKATLDRGFIQTSNRARYAQTPPKSGNTPSTPSYTPGRVPIGYNVLAQEITPSVVAKQALEALEFISHKSGPVRYFFISEHEAPFTRRPSRKGKGKEKDKELIKENKYPINILINLLGRPTIYENSFTLEQLTVVIMEITKVIPLLLKTIDDGKSDEKDITSEDNKTDLEAINPDTVPGSSTPGSNNVEEQKPTEDASGKNQKSAKNPKHHTPPFIPEKNYKLISSTLVLKDCSSKTSEQMLTIMKNLSSIEGVKSLFAKELVSQAISFGPKIISSLQNLNKAIKETKPGDEVSLPALTPFSSGSSDQARLLRALAALDYLFDHSRGKASSGDKAKENDTKEEDYLNSVYTSMNFGPLWKALSESLILVQENQSLLYVATSLLPLIESLMVICKHSSVKKISLRESNKTGNTNQFVQTNKADISKASLETLFFVFTDQHRKILNQLVRTNPKLMNGSFSILVKNPKSLEFDNKRRYFTKKLYGNSAPHLSRLNLNIQRETAFLDSYRALHFRTADEIKRGDLEIKFKGEEGVDAGGLTREWYQVMSRQMFNPDYALFTPVASDRTTFHPNRTSSVNESHLYYFKFIGRIIGKAIYDNKLLDCHFSRAMYKRILGKPVSLKDMENLDLDYYKSLNWMLENDITDIITETFSIEADDYGEVKIIDLKPNGRNIPVTEENKAEYVRLVCEYRLIESVRDQLNHFLEGFHDIIPKDIVSIFDEQELELLISGLPDIDIDDWRNNSVYQNYSSSSPQIKWFWRAVRSMDPEERAKLLQFVTGTSKVPLNGFKELVGLHGVSKFSIHREFGNKDRLPSSHTCFNQMDLPAYDSYETLRDALLKAITLGSESFELA